eukprot:jgi/Chlat1/4659/Chrsp3S00437
MSQAAAAAAAEQQRLRGLRMGRFGAGSSSSSSPGGGRSASPLPREWLTGPRIFSCGGCRAHAASADEGRAGRAYLFERVVNCSVGPAEDRLLITGMHTVADLRCAHCSRLLGWKYERAHEQSQKYKEGKFIIEKANMYKEGSGW